MTTAKLIPVQYTTGSDPVAHVAFADFSATAQAVPTGRLLDGSTDHGGAAEEWAESGYVTVDGENRPARTMYLFDAAEVGQDPEHYPWDAAHVARILLAD